MRRSTWLGCLVALCLFGCDDTEMETGTMKPPLPSLDSGVGEDTGPEVEDVEAREDIEAPEDTAPEMDAAVGPAPGTMLIEPANAVLDIAPGERQDIDFAAFLVGDDGELVALDNAQWTSDEPRAGSIEGFTGRFTTSGIGAQTTITAIQGERRATTTLTLVLGGVHFDEGTTEADSAAFEAPSVEVPERAPELIYPEDGTLLPSNIQGVTIQWEDRGLRLFRVHLRGRYLDMSVLTRSSIWLPEASLWQAIVRSSIGRPVEISVSGAELGEVFEGAGSIQISFAQDAVFGAIYYWSTTDAGIMRLPVGDLNPERFFTPASPVGSPCVGCHTLSRDGTRMAFNTAPVGIPVGPFMQIMTDDPTVRVVDLDQNINGMQPTFNPDGTRVVTGWSGTLTERDANGHCEVDMAFCVLDSDCAMGPCVTGLPIRDLPSIPNVQVAFPDWSPDDRWLVAAGSRLPIGFGVDFEIANAGLVLYPNFGGEWGPPIQFFNPRSDQENSFHPSFSPDGRWIAFNHSGPSLDPNDPNTTQTSALWLTSPTNRTAVELTRANLRQGLANNWPKWAPFTGRYLWLTFSSPRPYGKVPLEATPQIWVTAIDPVLAASGEDPSFPAFWLPGQSTASGNHIPYWAPFQKEPEPDE